MHEAEPSAQERLQTQSLRNVRALVEKLEREEKAKPRVVLAVLGAMAILLIGLVAYAISLRYKPSAVEGRRLIAHQTVLLSPAAYADHVVERISFFGNGDGVQALRASATGEATVHMVFGSRSGSPDVSIARASGDSQLDEKLLSIAKLTGTSGAPPPTADGKPIEFDVRLALASGKLGATRVKGP
jgi:hypothetical protein